MRRRSPFIDLETLDDGHVVSVRRDRAPVRARPHRRKPIVELTFEDGAVFTVRANWFELRLEFELDDLAERAVDKVKDLFDGPDDERDPTPVPLPRRSVGPVTPSIAPPGLPEGVVVVSDIPDADPDTDEGAPVPG